MLSLAVAAAIARQSQCRQDCPVPAWGRSIAPRAAELHGDAAFRDAHHLLGIRLGNA